MGRGGELGAHEGRYLRRPLGTARHLDGHLPQPLVAHDLPTDQKCVAGRQRRGKPLLDLAQWPPAHAVLQPDLQRIGILYRAEVHADLLCRARVAKFPQPVVTAFQPLPPIIGAQRIAAGRHHIQTGIEFVPRQAGIPAGGPEHFKKRARLERPPAGADQNMLAKNVPRAGPPRLAVKVGRRTASSAATHSTTSNRFAGTTSAFDGAL